MPDVINWSTSVAVSGGLSMSMVGSLPAPAYDVVETGLTTGANSVTKAVMPADDQLLALAITATRYDQKISYDLGSQTIPLDGPQLFVGEGMTGVFTNPDSVEVSSAALNTSVTIRMLVGRTGDTPPPS